jgi:hypothetical protein
MSKSQIYKIMSTVKEGKSTVDRRPFNSKKTIRTESLVDFVSAVVEEDRRVKIRHLSRVTGASIGTIYNILHKDLGLTKKSARWVPKLLTKEQKQERLRISQEFMELVEREGEEILGRIITMDESEVSYHTPETKRQSMQWIKKGSPGPIKAKVQASRTKQMVLAFFDQQGMIFTPTMCLWASLSMLPTLSRSCPSL